MSFGSKYESSWLSPRVGTLVIGFLDIVFGILGLSFLLLDAQDRHDFLFLFTKERTTLFDAVGESNQFLLEFWIPSFFLLILGLSLTLAAICDSQSLLLFSFVLNTLIVAGCVAGLVSLLITRKVGISGSLSLSIVTLSQIYFYVVVGTFYMEGEEKRHPEDKEMLVLS